MVELLKKVKELEEQYSKIADDLIDATWIADAQTLKIEYITSSFESISGYKPDELIKLTLKDLLTPKSYSELFEILKNEKNNYIAGQKKLIKHEIEAFHKNKGLYWLEIKAKYIDKNGQNLKLIGVAKDITHHKMFEKAQSDLIDKLNKAVLEKNKLLKEVKQLQTLLPICCGCKRIRDEDNRWWPLDLYVSKKTPNDLTHTICPDCSVIMYGKKF